MAVWVPCRPHDPDPAVFWNDFLAALTTKGVPTETTLETLQRSDNHRAEAITTLLHTMPEQPETLILCRQRSKTGPIRRSKTGPPVRRFLVCRVLGSDAGQGVDAAVA
jgi:hypothetical protein